MIDAVFQSTQYKHAQSNNETSMPCKYIVAYLPKKVKHFYQNF